MAGPSGHAGHDHEGQSGGHGGHGGHGWMMIACCIPMLAIAAVIAITTGSVGFLFAAVMCTLMMAMMMGGMSHGDDTKHQ